MFSFDFSPFLRERLVVAAFDFLQRFENVPSCIQGVLTVPVERDDNDFKEEPLKMSNMSLKRANMYPL